MAGFMSSFSSGLGSALSSFLTGGLLKMFSGDSDEQHNDFYELQKKADEKRNAELKQFVDKANLAQTNLINSINDNNDLLEHKYDETRKQKLESSKKRLATIRAYAGLHGTGNTNAIRNQLENVNDQTDDSLKDLKYNTQHQLNANTSKVKNFLEGQKLDYQGLLL